MNWLITSSQAELSKPNITIQAIASLVGTPTASFPVVMLGPLYNCSLDKNKNDPLRESKGNFNALMTLSPSSTEDLHWWVACTTSTFNVISHSKYDMVIQTNASTTGWSGVLGDTSTRG